LTYQANHKAKQYHYNIKRENGTPPLRSCIGNGTFELSHKKGVDTYQQQFLHIRTVYYS